MCLKFAMKNIILSILGSLMLLSQTTLAIEKCQDADGKWHYGDIAVAECQDSKVTTLNDRGYITAEDPAPKTPQELLAEEEMLAVEIAEQERLKQEQDERLRILSVYETEADIDRQRDNQLNSVQGNIDVHESYLKGMEARIERFENQKTELTSKRRIEELQGEIDQALVRVENSEQELALLLEQKTEIQAKFEKEKELYRELKSGDGS